MDRSTLDSISRDIERQIIDFWWEVDINWGENAVGYFTADGIYATSARERQGHTAIGEFYASRQARGERVSRHVVTNLQVRVSDENSAGARWILLLYAADGRPVLPSIVPNMVADGVDEFIREPDGIWRCRSRRLLPLFKSEVPTTG